MRILTLPLAVMLAASLMESVPALAQAQTVGTNAGANAGASSGSQAMLNYAPSENYAAPGSRVNNNVSAPDVIMQGNDVCTTAVGASAAGLGFSIGAAMSPLDKGCDRRQNAQWLWNMDQKTAAIALLCQDPNISAAMKTAGTPCPGTAPAHVAMTQPSRAQPLTGFVVPNGAMTTQELNDASAASVSNGG